MNDRFVMLCPKCSSTGLERYSDRQSVWGSLDDFVLKCRTCGKTLYGEEVCQAEHDRQKAAWKKARPEREQAAAAAHEQARQAQLRERHIAAALRKSSEEKRRREAQEQEEQRAERLAWVRKNASQVTQSPNKSPDHPKVATPPEGCAWQECSSPARDTSIYCSRSCSNKNARYRHKLRQQGKDPDTVAA